MPKITIKPFSSSPATVTTDLYRICRTCLKPRTEDKSSDIKFYSIFDTHPESHELIGSLLIDCTDIDLLMDQSRPITTSICKDCYGQLLRWYHFRETSKASNTFIMDSLSKKSQQSKAVKKRKKVKPVPAVESQLVEIENLAEEKIPLKAEPSVKIKIVTPASVVEKITNEPCVPVVKIQKVTKDMPPPIQIEKVETLAKVNQKALNVAPKVKIQKIAVDNEPTERTDNSVVTLLSDEDDVEMIDPVDNGVTITIDDDEQQKSDDSDDFHWPEIPEPETALVINKTMTQKTFYCCQCTKNFITRPEIQAHIDAEHAEYIAKLHLKAKSKSKLYPFHCEYCKIRYPSYKALINHQEYYGQAAKLCTICGEVVPNEKTSFAQHLRMHQATSETDKNRQPEIESNCCMCTATFVQRSDLLAHAEAVHSEQISRCMTKSNFSIEPWECDICTTKFATHALMRRHQLRYKEVEICPDCGILVPSFRRISHANFHLGSALNQHLCDICKKSFRSVGAIRLHMELHSTEIRLKCTYPKCEAILRTNQKLQLHLQDHKYRDLGKTIPCPEPGCKMMFYAHKPSQLARHKRIHTGKTYFNCTMCGKSFVDSTDFKRHQWQHAGVSPYMCKYCNKMHMRKNQLLAHEEICTQATSNDNDYSLAKNRSRRPQRQ